MNSIKNKILSYINGRTVTLLGIGISNLSVARFLKGTGIHISVRDGKRPSDEVLSELADIGAEIRYGDGYDEGMSGLIFRSPGIRDDIPGIISAMKNGAELTSETELFCKYCPCKIYAVTGSDGKTTTTTLISLLLGKHAEETGENVYYGGNNGRPLTEYLPLITEKDSVVLELSSFQLKTMSFSPYCSVITNITPNHLNWHTSMDEYIESKKNVFLNQTSGRAVFDADDGLTEDFIKPAKAEIYTFSAEKIPKTAGYHYKNGAIYNNLGNEKIINRDEILLPGTHNVKNFMAALCALDGRIRAEDIKAVAGSFTGVRHRIELVAQKDGVKYYNSSIDTTPSRTEASLNSFTGKTIVICGGYDKKIPLEPLADILALKAKYAVVTGDTGRRICGLLDKRGFKDYIYTDNFEDAVKRAVRKAERDDTVILSPGCASFDMFDSFESRGDRFCEIIKSIL